MNVTQVLVDSWLHDQQERMAFLVLGALPIRRFQFPVSLQVTSSTIIYPRQYAKIKLLYGSPQGPPRYRDASQHKQRRRILESRSDTVVGMVVPFS